MNIQYLETQYLKAKIAYYNGTPIMSDAAFDALEAQLKKTGSKVINQVGSKRKDFDFPHPTAMKSLAKIQTETENGVTNYMETEFMDWFYKRENVIRKDNRALLQIEYAPKYDGSAINIIYRNGELESVLTRGDGKFGKDVTDRFRAHLPARIEPKKLWDDDDQVIEIRCEAVMKRSIFEAKYAAEFANARNIVAGIIGKDDIDIKKVADLSLVPHYIIINGVHVSKKDFGKPGTILFSSPIFFSPEILTIRNIKAGYVKAIKEMEELRKTFDFQLDGVVFSLPVEFRELLGENEHDPEWAIAIKFIPDEVVTKVNGLEWSISKTGELIPIVLLEPVQLAGTIVKRASGYNAGYIVNNRIKKGVMVSIHKSGDIIPEIGNIYLND